METINVLSYNVSYGCMTNNPRDATAKHLAEHCKKLSEAYQKKHKKKMFLRVCLILLML